MIHHTTTSRRWDDSDRPYWYTRCTCAVWEVVTGTKAAGEQRGRAHERRSR